MIWPVLVAELVVSQLQKYAIGIYSQKVVCKNRIFKNKFLKSRKKTYDRNICSPQKCKN